MKVSRWRYTSDSLDRASGPALTDALLAEEAKYGATEDVCWAYAEALPELLGDAVNAGVIPLGFWRGNLTAAKIDTPVRIAGLEYVQTSSPEVCRLYAGEVPRFKVQGRPAVEALVEAGGQCGWWRWRGRSRSRSTRRSSFASCSGASTLILGGSGAFPTPSF